MGRGKKKKKSEEIKKSLDRVSLVLTVVVVSAFAIFAGYLVGQYAVQWVASPLVDTARIEDSGTRFQEGGGQEDGSTPVPFTPGPSTASSEPASTESTASRASSDTGTRAAGTGEDGNTPAASAGAQASRQPQSGDDAASVFRVHVGHYQSRDEAAQVANALKTGRPAIPDAWVLFDDSEGDYRVQVGAFSTQERARDFIAELAARGHDAYVAP